MAADKPPSAMSAAALPQLKKVESFWVLMAAVRGERWSRAADPGCLLEQKQSQRPVSDGYCLLRKAKQYDSLLGVELLKQSKAATLRVIAFACFRWLRLALKATLSSRIRTSRSSY